MTAALDDRAAYLPAGDTWETFAWPAWVPAPWRKLIADFWSPANGRGPAVYRQSALGSYNHHPHFGQRVSAASLTATGEPRLVGRWVPTWNNMGVVVLDDGTAEVSSTCGWRPLAVISPCGRYRYRLERELGALAGRGVCAFIMLNPSTADATEDDATIRRCRRFAADVGAARLVVGNLFAYRATDPAELYLASFATCAATGGDVVGPDNDRHLAAIIAEADTLIGAWGAASKCFGLVRARVPRVLELVAAAGKTLHALRVTKNGQPEHPVRLPAALRPAPWRQR